MVTGLLDDTSQLTFCGVDHIQVAKLTLSGTATTSFDLFERIQGTSTSYLTVGCLSLCLVPTTLVR